MEPPKITEIFIKSTMYHYSNTVLKTTKHRLDDDNKINTFENDYEFPMHKVQKIDDSELQEALAQVQCGLDNFKAIDFDVESFIENLATKTTIPLDELVSASASESASALLQVPNTTSDTSDTSDTSAISATSDTSIKNDKTLPELIHMYYEPISIKKISVEEEKIVEKEIQDIADTLKDTSKSVSRAYMLNTCKKSEAILIAKLNMLFNSLVFKTYDFSKDGFNPKSATVLYEQLYKVNVYIRQTETMEHKIYIGFPFYLSMHINMLGKIFIARNDIYKKIDTHEAIDKIHYYSSNTGFNILDLVTTSKFIRLITSNNFVSGFDLVSKLIHIMDLYKLNSDKLKFNKLKINFERFAKLYKKAINIVSEIPIRDL
jgi:hypothetical protein